MARALLLWTCASCGLLSAACGAPPQPWETWHDSSPYYPHRDYPRLTTPQWVGEPGVEAVVVLAIDDMRGHERWEQYLRPILQRLKQIDGRAPVSIMTCTIDPQQPHLQTWLNEGLSLEVHTIDHPCPLLQGNDLAKAQSTYWRCVDLLHQVPGNKPVAFRMPCCDSLNTLSPRFFDAIYRQPTAQGHFLNVDSSVFNIMTANDPDLTREQAFDSAGGERFRRYVPFASFVNTIEDYPYPYIIDGICWEFPCVVPSDWSAQHLQKPANPQTIADLKIALDVVVQKQGVYNLVFHPYDWIRNTQVVELIDHAVQQHGSKVKFLTFREALQRINQNLLDGQTLRGTNGVNNGVQLVDLNRDGFQDVVVVNEQVQFSRVWDPATKSWQKQAGPASVTFAPGQTLRFDGRNWNTNVEERRSPEVLTDDGVRYRDLDGDGIPEMCVGRPDQQGIFRWKTETARWEEAEWSLPSGVLFVDEQGRDAGLRLIDINDDDRLDLIFSNGERYHLALWTDDGGGWQTVLLSGRRGDKPAEEEFPAIVQDGLNRGFWAHSRHFWWQNEDTAKLPNLVDRRAWSALLGDAEPGPKAPLAALHTVQARGGFTVEQMAAEPLTLDPVAFEWGADGKLWIAEMADYPLGVDGKGTPGGRVRYLEDTDGDGQYDRSTLFLTDVPYPTGVLPWKKGVLVSTAPDIFYAEDTDGDGKADIREVLFTGFAPGNQQHRVNGLVYGLDNWVYCANGDSGGEVQSLKTGETQNINGRDLRIQPETGALEAQTGQTQFGRNRDDWGNWFGCNNSNPMYQFVLDDHYLRRNPHAATPDSRVNVPTVPGASPVFPRSVTRARFNDHHTANRFTSACSAMFYRDELFGPQFSNSLFVSEPVHNLVHREVWTADGVTFHSQRAPDEQSSEFLASTDNWFRPTMIKTGPDGALWVADMYRHVIEHPQWIPLDWQQRLDLRAGQDKGRLYRVFPIHVKPRAIPRLDQLATPELVAALDSPSGWQRDTAQRLLIERHDPAATPLLQKLAQTAERPLARLHALCTLDGLHSLTKDDIVHALQDAHPGMRRHGIRLAERFPEPSADVIVELKKLADDADAHVRLQLAYTLGELHDPAAGQILGRLLAATQDDRFLSAAALSSIQADNLTEVLTAALQPRESGTASTRLINQLLNLAAAFNQQDALVKLVQKVIEPSPEKGFEPWQFEALQTLLASRPKLADELSQWAKSEDPAQRAAADRLPKFREAAYVLAGDESQPLSTRIAAAGVLGQAADTRDRDAALIAGWLAPQSDPELRAAAVELIGGHRVWPAPVLLLDTWPSLSPRLRGRVLDLLLTRAGGPAALIQALDQGQVEVSAFDAARRQRLIDTAPRSQREKLLRLLSAASESRTAVLDRFQEVLQLTPDAQRGRELFAKTCAQCHKFNGTGHEVGPDLAALTDRSTASLLVALLDPNRAVEAKFLSYTVLTTGGQTFSGILSAEASNSLTLRAAEAKEQVILRRDVDELIASPKSFMPEGLEKDLNPQAVADIIAYVQSAAPARPRKEFTGNEPAVVKPTAQGAISLSARTAEIYGPSLVFEAQYTNLGYWMSSADLAQWKIEVPQSGTYDVLLDWACHADSANQLARLDAGSQSLVFKVESTVTWDQYRQKKIGELQLKGGPQTVSLRSAEELQGPLIDLKSVRLVPRK